MDAENIISVEKLIFNVFLGACFLDAFGAHTWLILISKNEIIRDLLFLSGRNISRTAGQPRGICRVPQDI